MSFLPAFSHSVQDTPFTSVSLILAQLNDAICLHMLVWIIYCWLALCHPFYLFGWLRKGNVCRKHFSLNYSVVRTVLKMIKSSSSVFKHSNISEAISVLNFLWIFILLNDHRSVNAGERS